MALASLKIRSLPWSSALRKTSNGKSHAPLATSSPMLVANQLVLTAFENNKLFTIAYDRTSGKELWRAEAPARQIEAFDKGAGSPANSTPATDGTRIVSYFGFLWAVSAMTSQAKNSGAMNCPVSPRCSTLAPVSLPFSLTVQSSSFVMKP